MRERLGAIVTATLVAGIAATPGPASAQQGVSARQDFLLQPGWNAVFLEVDPEPGDPPTLFAGIPVESAWKWHPRRSRAEYIEDPAEGLTESDWLAYFPSPPRAILTNLFALRGGQAYLIRIGGGTAVPWSVTGRPSLERHRWLADSFNLVGAHVDPAGPPSFAAYFAPSPAHAGQPVYRLQPSGSWVQASWGEAMRPGEAFWVYCAGASDYEGPLVVEAAPGGLDFGTTLEELTLELGNRSGGDLRATVGFVQGSVPLRHWTWWCDPARYTPEQCAARFGEVRWEDLPAPLALPEDGEPWLDGAERRVPLRVQRRLLATAGLLEVRGAGTRWLVPVAASGIDPRGLWVGTVTVDAVSRPQVCSAVEDPAAASCEPAIAAPGGPDPRCPFLCLYLATVPAGQLLDFRVLVHVDGTGQARLLKEVTMMWKEGVLGPDPVDPTRRVVVTPGAYVLVVNDERIPEFSGAALRDGRPVGYRLSAVTYDFAPGQLYKSLGPFQLGGTLQTTLSRRPGDPTNPYLHRYHPDHDNLDAYGAALPQDRPEAYGFLRAMSFTVSSGPDPDDPPGWGSTYLDGTYRERIAPMAIAGKWIGLHRSTIEVGGRFELRRVSPVAELQD